MHLTTHLRRAAVAVLLSLSLVPLGCSGGGEEEQASKKAEKPTPTIQPVDGMKYYVGGPIMRHDKYGRLRLGGFNGEVAGPTSRGLLIGYKLDADGKTFDYRTWINGRPVSKSTGFLDPDGLLWFAERETYDSNGKVIARQSFKYNDEAKVMTSLVQQLDAETGAVLNTHTMDMPYTPPEQPDIPDDDEAEGEGEGGSETEEPAERDGAGQQGDDGDD